MNAFEEKLLEYQINEVKLLQERIRADIKELTKNCEYPLLRTGAKIYNLDGWLTVEAECGLNDDITLRCTTMQRKESEGLKPVTFALNEMFDGMNGVTEPNFENEYLIVKYHSSDPIPLPHTETELKELAAVRDIVSLYWDTIKRHIYEIFDKLDIKTA